VRLNYQFTLEDINKLPDSTFQKVISGDNLKYFPYNHFNSANMEHTHLFEKIKSDSFKRTLIEQAIDDIDKKVEDQNKEKSISILGLNIPIKPVNYVAMLIILILFHDFAQVIIYRNQIHRKIRRFKVPDWKLGFEFFGFYNNSNSAAYKFLGFTSSIIAGVLIICPLITSILILGLNNFDVFFSILNIVCFSLIIIDTVIIFYIENIWNFRFYSNRYLGKHNTDKTTMRMIWMFPILFVSALHLGIATALDTPSKLVNILYFILCCAPLVLLYLSLEKTYSNPTNLNRSIRAGVLIINLFWIFTMFHNAFTFEKWEYYQLQDVFYMLIIVSIVSACTSFVYMRYFMIIDNKKPT
jgi:hypothetical protein